MSGWGYSWNTDLRGRGCCDDRWRRKARSSGREGGLIRILWASWLRVKGNGKWLLASRRAEMGFPPSDLRRECVFDDKNAFTHDDQGEGDVTESRQGGRAPRTRCGIALRLVTPEPAGEHRPLLYTPPRYHTSLPRSRRRRGRGFFAFLAKKRSQFAVCSPGRALARRVARRASGRPGCVCGVVSVGASSESGTSSLSGCFTSALRGAVAGGRVSWLQFG